MMTDYRSYEMSSRERVVFFLSLTVMIAACGLLYYQSLLAVAVIPFIYKRTEAFASRILGERRRKLLRLQFRDLLYCLSASFATGRHMTEAMEEASQTLEGIYGKESMAVAELDHMGARIRETGVADVTVWSDFAERSGIDDISDFADVFMACRETGGNLVSAVNKAASVIGEKISVETDIKAIVSQKKYEGLIISLMPAVVILFLRIMSADYLDIMYSTMAGRILMTAALAGTIAAGIAIERITSIEI
jgi:Flp pilus assembly protein TadB